MQVLADYDRLNKLYASFYYYNDKLSKNDFAK